MNQICENAVCSCMFIMFIHCFIVAYCLFVAMMLAITVLIRYLCVYVLLLNRNQQQICVVVSKMFYFHPYLGR